MEGASDLVGTVLILVGLAGAIVEPMVLRRAAERSPSLRENLGVVVPAVFLANAVLFAVGLVLLVHGDRLLG